MLQIENNLFEKLLAQAAETSRLRMHFDLRDGIDEDSQRMLNALLPGTPLPIHRHNETSETVIILKGSMDEIFYDAEGNETERHHLNPTMGMYGIQIPIKQYHGVEVYEPSVIIEFKAVKYDVRLTEDILENKR